MESLLVVLLLTAVGCCSAWTQKYGDAASTSYVDFNGEFKTGWVYTQFYDFDWRYCSSPAVSDQGVILGINSNTQLAEVVALSPMGNLLWGVGLVVPNGTENVF